jgi:hypothetical protein
VKAGSSPTPSTSPTTTWGMTSGHKNHSPWQQGSGQRPPNCGKKGVGNWELGVGQKHTPTPDSPNPDGQLNLIPPDEEQLGLF